MTQHQIPGQIDHARDTTTVRSLRGPAWLLIATLPAYVLFLVVSVILIASRVEISSGELTPAQIGELGIGWVAVAITWVLPPVLAAIALALIARRLPAWGSIVPVLSAVAVSLAVIHVIVSALGSGADAPTWAQSGLFHISVVTSILMGWLGIHPATLLVLWALLKAGIARKTAIVVGILYVLFWAFELLVYLPILLDPEALAGDISALPPFLLGFFWAVVGGALLRARVASDA